MGIHNDGIMVGGNGRITAQNVVTGAGARIHAAAPQPTGRQRRTEGEDDRIDTVVLTALPVEAAAMAEALGRGVLRRHGVDLPTGTVGGRKVLVYPLGGMGNAGAAQAAQTAITTWRPRWLVLAGIAGGVSGGALRLGDVLIPDQVIGYESARVGPDGAARRFEVYRPDPMLLGIARALPPQRWVHDIGPARPDGAGTPAVHVGPVFSGEKVLADGVTLAGLHRVWPKAIGVEMEAMGVALAAYRNGPGFLMVKAACDFADAAKDDRWHRYAAHAAARFTVALLERAATVD